MSGTDIPRLIPGRLVSSNKTVTPASQNPFACILNPPLQAWLIVKKCKIYVKRLHTQYIFACAVSFFAEDRAMKHCLVITVGGSTLFPFVYVAVKYGESDEKSHADEVFHALDVRVVIYQRENLFDFAN